MLVAEDPQELREFPASLVRQYLFCPRIPYFVELLGIKANSPLWVQQGTDHHTREAKLFQRRDLSRFGISDGRVELNTQVSSKRLGVHGVADMAILGRDKGTILEFKLDKRSIHRGAVFQLTCYLIAAAETFGMEFSRGFFVFGTRGKSFSVDIDQKIIDDLERTLDQMREMFAVEILPHSSATAAQCGQCEFIQRCNDRD